MFLFAVALDVALMLVVTLRLPKTSPSTTLPYASLLFSLWTMIRKEPVLRAASLTGFLMFAAFSALWGSLAALLAEPPYGYGSDLVGAFGFVGIAGLMASAWIGRMVDRLGSRAVLIAGAFTVLVAFAFVGGAGSHIGLLIVAMVLLDLGNRAGLVANQSRIYALSAEARSRLNTVFMTCYFFGGATGTGVATRFTQHFGWFGLAACGTVFAALALLTTALTRLKTV